MPNLKGNKLDPSATQTYPSATRYTHFHHLPTKFILTYNSIPVSFVGDVSAALFNSPTCPSEEHGEDQKVHCGLAQDRVDCGSG